jgi:hypothetical protein
MSSVERYGVATNLILPPFFKKLHNPTEKQDKAVDEKNPTDRSYAIASLKSGL